MFFVIDSILFLYFCDHLLASTFVSFCCNCTQNRNMHNALDVVYTSLWSRVIEGKLLGRYANVGDHIYTITKGLNAGRSAVTSDVGSSDRWEGGSTDPGSWNQHQRSPGALSYITGEGPSDQQSVQDHHWRQTTLPARRRLMFDII